MKANTAAHQSWMGYTAISEVHHFIEGKIIHEWTAFYDSCQSGHQNHPEVRLCNGQRECKKPKSYISLLNADSTTRNRLNEYGSFGRVARETPLLSK